MHLDRDTVPAHCPFTSGLSKAGRSPESVCHAVTGCGVWRQQAKAAHLAEVALTNQRSLRHSPPGPGPLRGLFPGPLGWAPASVCLESEDIIPGIPRLQVMECHACPQWV